MALTDQVVVVTGASSGIGEATARTLSDAGAKLVVTARRADQLATLARSLPGESAVLAADIADPAVPQRLLSLAQEKFGRVDGVINNAGMLAMGKIDDVDVDELCQMIRVNLDAVVRCSYLFGRVFKAQGSGAIVNITSGAADGLFPAMGVYSAVKSGVLALTGALRIELGPYGVKVGSIAPAGAQTAMLEEMYAKQGAPQKTGNAESEDVAAAIRFMLEQPARANVAAIQLYATRSPV